MRRKGVYAIFFSFRAGPKSYPVWSLLASVSEKEFTLLATHWGISTVIEFFASVTRLL